MSKKEKSGATSYELGKADALNGLNDPMVFRFASLMGVNEFRGYVEGFCSTPQGAELAAEIGIFKDDFVGQTETNIMKKKKEIYKGERLSN